MCLPREAEASHVLAVWLTALAAALTAAWWLPSFAAAEEWSSAHTDYAVQQATYSTTLSTGSSGNTLSWRSVMPAPRQIDVDDAARPLGEQRAARANQTLTVQPAQLTLPLSDPFADPFGDGQAGSPRLLSAAQPGTLPPAPGTVMLPFGEPCPEPEDLKKIGSITNEIAPTPGEFPPECGLGGGIYPVRMFPLVNYTWKASGLCHKPLYFEEVHLERYGHTTGRFTQPFISGAHFFASAVTLPYWMGVDPPWECKYPLGYYRPGDCAPMMIRPIPLSLRGAALQGAAVVGVGALAP